jgi:hypothetical protein
MTNPVMYLSPRAEELPQDFVNDIIELLNNKQARIQRYYRENIDSTYHKEELRIILRFLDELDLHACYDIIGHRDTYCFPNREDCEDWEDWIWQCIDIAD